MGNNVPPCFLIFWASILGEFFFKILSQMIVFKCLISSFLNAQTPAGSGCLHINTTRTSCLTENTQTRVSSSCLQRFVCLNFALYNIEQLTEQERWHLHIKNPENKNVLEYKVSLFLTEIKLAIIKLPRRWTEDKRQTTISRFSKHIVWY